MQQPTNIGELCAAAYKLDKLGDLCAAAYYSLPEPPALCLAFKVIKVLDHKQLTFWSYSALLVWYSSCSLWTIHHILEVTYLQVLPDDPVLVAFLGHITIIDAFFSLPSRGILFTRH